MRYSQHLNYVWLTAVGIPGGFPIEEPRVAGQQALPAAAPSVVYATVPREQLHVVVWFLVAELLEEQPEELELSLGHLMVGRLGSRQQPFYS